MFRQYDVTLARDEEADDHALASRSHPPYSPAWFAELALLKLGRIAELGLMDCYSGLNIEWLCDFWAGMPWTDQGCRQAVALILADPRFEAIRAGLQAEFGLDLGHELRSNSHELNQD
jgi:hypothetical protein